MQFCIGQNSTNHPLIHKCNQARKERNGVSICYQNKSTFALVYDSAENILGEKTKMHQLDLEVQRFSIVVRLIYFISMNGVNSTLFERHGRYADR